MNLHYSQTDRARTQSRVCFFTYEFTLLSNYHIVPRKERKVFLPMNLHYSQTGYGSNVQHIQFFYLWIYTTLKLSSSVSLISICFFTYEFTLLSNWQLVCGKSRKVFLPMNLHYSQTVWGVRRSIRQFFYLWIYTTLKLSRAALPPPTGFFTYEFTLLSNRAEYVDEETMFFYLWIYTTLKPQIKSKQ